MSDQSALETGSILVVDDEPAIRYSVGKTLQKVGYHVRDASSGEEALEIIKSQSFDVVLTDILMPSGLDGVELVRRIKEIDPDAVVILMTGYPSLSTAVEALRLGANDYLIKPSSTYDIRHSVALGIERARNLKRRRALLDAIRSNVQELARSTDETPKLRQLDGAALENTPAPTDPIEEGLAAMSMGQVMTLGPLTIFPGRYQISIEDQAIDLTPTEFDLLLYLAAHRGRVISCHELVFEVRGYELDEAEAREVVRPHVSNLRRKLKNVSENAECDRQRARHRLSS